MTADGRSRLERLKTLGVVEEFMSYATPDGRQYAVRTDLGISKRMTEEETKCYTDGALAALRAVLDGSTIYHPAHKGFVNKRELPLTGGLWQLHHLATLAVDAYGVRAG